MFVSRVGAMLDDGFNTGSSLRIFTEKDMPLVLNAGRLLGVPMVTASAALQTMQLAAAFGLEDASDARLSNCWPTHWALQRSKQPQRPAPANRGSALGFTASRNGFRAHHTTLYWR